MTTKTGKIDAFRRRRPVALVGASWMGWMGWAGSASALGWLELPASGVAAQPDGAILVQMPGMGIARISPGHWQVDNGQLRVSAEAANLLGLAVPAPTLPLPAPVSAPLVSPADASASGAMPGWVGWAVGGTLGVAAIGGAAAWLVYQQVKANIIADLEEVPERAENQKPVIDSPTSISVDEGFEGMLLTVSASDDGATPPRLSMENSLDSEVFTFDPATGALSFIVPPNYEAALDADRDNVYDIVILATDDEALTTRQSISVRVEDVSLGDELDQAEGDEGESADDGGESADGGAGSDGSDQDDTPSYVAPTWTGETDFTRLEGDASAIMLEAQANMDGLTVSYWIQGGADADAFKVDAESGALRFVGPSDYDARADANGDNRYELVIGFNDGVGAQMTQALSVTLEDVDDESIAWTRIKTTATVVEEKTRSTGITFDAKSSLAAAEVVYSLSGEDAAIFEVRNQTVVFDRWPNYERVVSADGDRVFELTVTATDSGGNQVTKDVEITLQNVIQNFAVFGDGWLDNSSFAQRANDYTLYTNQANATWVDVLSRHYGVDRPVNVLKDSYDPTSTTTIVDSVDHDLYRAAGPSQGTAPSNLAYGGAGVINSGAQKPPSLATQVETGLFMASQLYPRDIPDDVTSFIQIGLEDLAANPNDASVANRVVSGILASVERGIQATADSFVVASLVDITLTPFWDTLSGTQRTSDVAMRTAIEAANHRLQSGLEALEDSYSGVSIAYLDVNAVLDDLIASPSSFGLTNTDDAWLSDGAPGAATTYLWYNDLHPTTTVHDVLAASTIDLLG